MFQELLHHIHTTITPDQHILLALSGGPDSMLVFWALKTLVDQNKLKSDHIHLVHANHHTRATTDQEQDLVTQRTHGFDLTIIHHHDDTKDENTLRKRRKQHIIDHAQSINANIAMTGHNLTDRIETTLMNMLRGCHLTGLINMQSLSTDPIHQLTWYRPLLDRAKPDIQDLCTTMQIPHVTDPTNHDQSISLRNQIRHDFLLPLAARAHSSQIFWESWKLLYHSLEQSNTKTNLTLHHTSDPNILEVTKTGERTDNHSVALLQQLGIYYDLSTNYIQQLTHVCRTTGKQMSTHGWTIYTHRHALICKNEKNQDTL